MNVDEIRKVLLGNPDLAKEIRTNDGRVFVVRAVEQWALGKDTLVVMHGPSLELNLLSVRNVASIGLLSPAPG